MNRLKAWVRAFFGFSRTETNAFLLLLPLMVIIIFTEPAYQYFFTHQPQDFSKESKKLDSILAAMQWKKKDSTVTKIVEQKLFAFDPNKISTDSLELVGLSSFLARRISNYRYKGGKFFSTRDVKKIYGMDSAWISKVESYLIFPKKIEKIVEPKIVEPKKRMELIHLNEADTTQLKSIYGIGSKLSARIINYRNKLGGFVSMNQLKEVYGLDSLVIKEVEKRFFIEPNFKPVTLDLNLANEKELAAHPYIKSKLAKAITAYRYQHGNFQHVEDLKKISILSEEAFEKIKPYLSAKP
jgi:competence ComEA-like helix-hairpin-helix protein